MSLTGSGYLAEGTTNAAVLLHGTNNKPANDFNSGLIWGDHYLLEAMLRERLLRPRQVALPVVAASASGDDGNPAANAIDGDASTRWSAAGDGQWLELDLGSVHDVGKVDARRSPAATAARRASTSRPRPTESSWTTQLSTLSSGRTETPEALDFPDVAARFLRIVGHGTSTDTANAISEAGVHVGAVVRDTTPPPVPVAAPAPGVFTAPVDVTLSSEPGAVIRYTSDGSEPNGTSAVSTAPIHIDSTRTLKAIAFDAAGNASAPATFAYVVQAMPFAVRLSSASSRANPVDLAGRTVAGNAYMFTAPTTGVTRVDFSLDGTFRRSDTGAPFDLVGGSSGAATAFDTRTVGDGRHTVRAVIQRAAGAGQTLDSTFTVQNGTPWFIRYSTSSTRSNPIDLDGRTVTGSDLRLRQA